MFVFILEYQIQTNRQRDPQQYSLCNRRTLCYWFDYNIFKPIRIEISNLFNFKTTKRVQKNKTGSLGLSSLYISISIVFMQNRGRDIDGGQDTTTCLIMYECPTNCDWLIQVYVFRLVEKLVCSLSNCSVLTIDILKQINIQRYI